MDRNVSIGSRSNRMKFMSNLFVSIPLLNNNDHELCFYYEFEWLNFFGLNSIKSLDLNQNFWGFDAIHWELLASNPIFKSNAWISLPNSSWYYWTWKTSSMVYYLDKIWTKYQHLMTVMMMMLNWSTTSITVTHTLSLIWDQ